jgi:hypothetical protein
MTHDLATQRDQCMSQLATIIREATRAVAALDIENVERCTQAQSVLCHQLSTIARALCTEGDYQPASIQLHRELAGAMRTYKALLRRSSHWIETSCNTLQLITGSPVSGSSFGHRLSY